jgi:hypothetical protein
LFLLLLVLWCGVVTYTTAVFAVLIAAGAELPLLLSKTLLMCCPYPTHITLQQQNPESVLTAAGGALPMLLSGLKGTAAAGSCRLSRLLIACTACT